ncbi:MAG: exodeoxyribonuclease VII large subunit [Flavobacteriales bacterium]|jgi:exodeoxyribonuclease VII large subunit
MPELIAGKKAYTLFEVAESIRKVIAERYTSRFWIKAEMNKLNHYPASGHCYPELVHKEGTKIKAEFRSVLWKTDFERINRQFKTTLGEPLHDGIKILFEAGITFDAQYGMTIRIYDIDVSYTLGDLEAEKNASIERLKSEGILMMNKQVHQALLPRRIAIISIETSKGYADFRQILQSKKERFAVFHMLFPALLQGDKAVDSIVKQLNRIRLLHRHFDVVAIIRGGGGEVGLTCFNHYALARTIATFPIPVYTGIGHATNETVSELVAHFNGITPTKVAEHILSQFEAFEQTLITAQRAVTDYSSQLAQQCHRDISTLGNRLQQAALRTTQSRMESIGHLQARIVQGNRFYAREAISQLNRLNEKLQKAQSTICEQQFTELTATEQKLIQTSLRMCTDRTAVLEINERLVNMLDPKNVLKRGYSITLNNGKPVTTFENVASGDQLQTIVYNGTIESTVTQAQAES